VCCSTFRNSEESHGLEPGEAVTAKELEKCVVAEVVELGEGDFLVFRTGHHRRRLELGAWDNSPPPIGEGKAGLHIDAIPWMHERHIAAFLPDGDGETLPSVVDGVTYPIHALQVVAMGMSVSDSLQFEDLVTACEEEGRYDLWSSACPCDSQAERAHPGTRLRSSRLRTPFGTCAYCREVRVLRQAGWALSDHPPTTFR